MIRALFGLLPAGLSLLFYLLAPFLGEVGALTAPLEALIRSLIGLLAFFGPAPAFARDPAFGVLFLAYAGAVLDPDGWRGAPLGLLLGLLAAGLDRFARRRGPRGCPVALFFGLLLLALLLAPVAALYAIAMGTRPDWIFALYLAAAPLTGCPAPRKAP